ncbi:hypothetical protein PoB_006998300 [Plakobranchus ocellatus]|uniref:Uncharacterized protein n=1 Tax=Plakobranchus ocellatus TaxID=259542 RepID=A0AAV4DHE9_9GAST|nr:hypothetical protein PoB_006998300 [Plakobranchus ocellatus]
MKADKKSHAQENKAELKRRKLSETNSNDRSKVSPGPKKGVTSNNMQGHPSEPEHRKKEKLSNPKITKPQPRKIQVGGKMKGGVKVIKSSGDFLGRLGTLVVMLVTMISTGVVMVSSFVEGVYWKGALLAALMLFIHLPVTGAMIWIMCKARVQSLYNKIRPRKPAGDQAVIVEEEEETNDVVEGIEVTDDKVALETETNGFEQVKPFAKRSVPQNKPFLYRGSANQGFEGDT